jgi:hypothetical protein
LDDDDVATALALPLVEKAISVGRTRSSAG